MFGKNHRVLLWRELAGWIYHRALGDNIAPIPVGGVPEVNIVRPDSSLIRRAARDLSDGVEERGEHVRIVVGAFVLQRQKTDGRKMRNNNKNKKQYKVVG